MLRKPITALAGALMLVGIVAAPGRSQGRRRRRQEPVHARSQEPSSRSLPAARTSGRRSSSRSTRTSTASPGTFGSPTTGATVLSGVKVTGHRAGRSPRGPGCPARPVTRSWPRPGIAPRARPVRCVPPSESAPVRDARPGTSDPGLVARDPPDLWRPPEGAGIRGEDRPPEIFGDRRRAPSSRRERMALRRSWITRCGRGRPARRRAS